MHGAKKRAVWTFPALPRRAGITTSVAAMGAVGAVCLLAPSTAWATENHVRDVRVRAVNGEEAEVEIIGTETPTYGARLDGSRLLVDIRNSDLAGAPTALHQTVGVVGGVLTQPYRNESGAMTRLAIHLNKQVNFRISVEGTTLRVRLVPLGTSATPIPAPSSPAPAADAGQAELTDVRFERGGASSAASDRVVLSLSRIPTYALGAQSGRLRLELKASKVSESLVRTLDVSAFQGPLTSVSTFADQARGVVLVELQRAGDVPGNLVVEGNRLVWSFARAKPEGFHEAPRPKDGGPGRRTVTVARETMVDAPRVETSIRAIETVGSEEAGFASTLTPQMRAQAPGQGRYTGRRIDLDLKDADIHNILRLLADVGKVNIVTADDVQGSITIRMRNVPWDQALDVVLQAKSLGMVRGGNLIRVAPMAQLQKERELYLAKQKQEFEMTPLETRLIPVSYAQADELQARAKDLLSPRGSIAVDERTNVLIARDIAANLNHIEELVRSLDTQTPQVLVEARIVEATSRYQRDFGIQWGGDATFSQATGNPTGIAFPASATMAGGASDANTPTAGLSPVSRTVANPNFAVNLPAAVGTGTGGALGLSFGSLDSNFNLNLRLSAAELSGLLRVVSSPRVLTLDNREARINQGTLIPFAQVSAMGVQTTFQEAKLQLLVRPHVTADGSVSMHVKVTRDEPDFNQTSPRGDPTILKREAETDLLVMDGHTAVIGGIYTRNTGRNLDQVPFFGDIPILGVLFQRRRASDTRNELVIFLTPRIVNRAEALGR